MLHFTVLPNEQIFGKQNVFLMRNASRAGWNGFAGRSFEPLAKINKKHDAKCFCITERLGNLEKVCKTQFYQESNQNKNSPRSLLQIKIYVLRITSYLRKHCFRTKKRTSHISRIRRPFSSWNIVAPIQITSKSSTFLIMKRKWAKLQMSLWATRGSDQKMFAQS